MQGRWKRLSRRMRMVAGAVVVTVVAGGGVGLAYGEGAFTSSIPDGGGVVRGCVSTSGTLRTVYLIDPSTGANCPSGFVPVSWNQQGPSGPIGATGPSGAMGAPGGSGPSGASGAAGPSGPSGAKGDTGLTGSSGPSGAVGLQGPSGVSGGQGMLGPSGPTGAAGMPGPSGPSGPSGARGPAGTATQPWALVDGLSGGVTRADPNHVWTASLLPGAAGRYQVSIAGDFSGCAPIGNAAEGSPASVSTFDPFYNGSTTSVNVSTYVNSASAYANFYLTWACG